ncbi:MAG: 30S ribosomal protein S9 [Candidatus Pacearchaeota archaeon]|nr:30S ribosomal protein S9 [Candidatus Pacearchaeota archaeon]
MPRKTKEIKLPKKKVITALGKRKTAVAKATISDGNGKFTVNKKPLQLFNHFQSLTLREPLILAKEVLGDQLEDVNVAVIVTGGGAESQIEAARLAIARSLVAWFKLAELKSKFLKYDRMLLVADTRRKESRKWGDSKARAARQKSYR